MTVLDRIDALDRARDDAFQMDELDDLDAVMERAEAYYFFIGGLFYEEIDPEDLLAAQPSFFGDHI